MPNLNVYNSLSQAVEILQVVVINLTPLILLRKDVAILKDVGCDCFVA
jgi:hypothetical protein